MDILVIVFGLILLAVLIYGSYRGVLVLHAIDDMINHRYHDTEGTAKSSSSFTGDDTLRSKVLEVARRYIGVSEQPIGSNRGPVIDEFIRFTGLVPPQPWCAAFVSFCVHRAAQELGVTTNFPKTAWTPAILAFGQRTGRLVDKTAMSLGAKPRPGDVFLLYYPAVNRVAHTGFIEKVFPLFVRTIEGNTNDQGGREGYKVARRLRRIRSLHSIVRL